MEISTLFQIIGLIMGIVIHEFAHGFVADILGDPTARLQGRVSLNPLVHIDPFFTILLPFLLFISGSPIIFGAAKPVPFNPYLLKNRKWGPFLVAIAGPLANFSLIITFSFSLKILIHFALTFGIFQYFISFLAAVIAINIILMVINLIPIPPLDGSKILYLFLPSRYLTILGQIEYFGFFFLIFFIIFFRNYLWKIISFLLQIFVPIYF